MCEQTTHICFEETFKFIVRVLSLQVIHILLRLVLLPVFDEDRSALRCMQCAVFSTSEKARGSFYSGENNSNNNIDL